MKRITMLLCAILVGSFCTTCFAHPYAVGVPYYGKTKTVYPRIVQREVVAPACCPTACPVVDARVARVKTVYPRIVQREVVAPACCATDAVVEVLPRPARTRVTYPRVVQWGIVMP